MDLPQVRTDQTPVGLDRTLWWGCVTHFSPWGQNHKASWELAHAWRVSSASGLNDPKSQQETKPVLHWGGVRMILVKPLCDKNSQYDSGLWETEDTAQPWTVLRSSRGERRDPRWRQLMPSRVCRVYACFQWPTVSSLAVRTAFFKIVLGVTRLKKQ